MRIGVAITTSQTPPATGSTYNTANAFMIGVGDAGSSTTVTKCASINDVTAAIGPRSATNSVLWDSADVFFREGGGLLFLSRALGSGSAAATLTLQDANTKPSVVITAKSAGVAANGFTASVAVGSGSTFTATTATSTALTAISSFAGIAPGTLVTGTGIPTGTFIVSVNTGASTAVLSQATTASGTGVVVTPGTFTVTLTGPSGTEVHGPFINTAALYADTSSQLVNFSQSAASQFTINNPATLSATALTGGLNGSAPTLSQAQTALANFTITFGPGQVSAPGYTNTTLNGIWSALATHAQANNRVAICDMDDQQTSATLITALGSFGSNAAASYTAFWAGQVVVPSSTNAPGVTRTVPASAVISALCARVDAAGNPNQPAAGNPNGFNLQLQYATGFTGVAGAPLYAQTDIDTLNAAGINTWNNLFGVLQNYGFVSPVLSSTDTIYWQFNHARMRMALEAMAEAVGQPFVFSQISQLDIAAFSADLAGQLVGYVRTGAISTIAPNGSTDQGFVVDTGPTVNTAATMAAGQLLANVSYRPAPFAQLVQVNLNAVPVTAAL